MKDTVILSIIIPCFNEQKTIYQTIEKTISTLKNNNCQLIIVDDGSSDQSSNIIRTIKQKYPQLFCIFHKKNQGKGAAIRTGIGLAMGKFTIIQDADLEYNPQEIMNILQSAIKNDLTVVYGSRNLLKHRSASTIYYFGAWVMTFLGNLLYKQKITDQYTCYKLIRTDIFKKLNIESNGFELEAEITAKLSRLGFKIKEIPITYQPRNKKDGKKINFRDAIKGLLTLIKYVNWKPIKSNNT